MHNLVVCAIARAYERIQAWLSGARNWTPAQREAFANDLTRPQLVAVTDNLNDSKG